MLRRLAPIVITLVVTFTATPAFASWTTPVVLDGAGGTNGRVNAQIGADTAAAWFGGVRHVFYSEYVNGRYLLRHATLGAPAAFETLDGAGGTSGRTTHDVGSDVSAAVFGGLLHVFYRDDTGGNLRHTWFDGSSWRFQTLDGASTIGGRVNSDVGRRSVTTVFDGKLFVAYLDVAKTDVRLAHSDGSGWSFRTIDGDSTAGGHTTHEVGYNLDAKIWSGTLHILYYERDPAYGEALGWVREARFDGAAWTYARDFRVNTIVLGKTLAVGVGSDSRVYVAYNTTLQADPRLRWRVWDGDSWSDSSLLEEILFGDVSASALFVVLGGVPMLVFSDVFNGSIDFFTWSGGGVTSQSISGYSGYPTSALKAGPATFRVFLGGGSTPTDFDVLLSTTGH
jgi:hypothetical protein